MITLDETPEEAAWLSEVNIGRHEFVYEEDDAVAVVGGKSHGTKSLDGSVVFESSDWHRQLIDTIAPPLAKAYAKAMFEEVGAYVKGRGIEKEEKHGSHNQLSHGRGRGSGAGGALNVTEHGKGGKQFLKGLGGSSQDLAALAGGAPGDDIQISYSKNSDGDHEAIIELTGKDDTHDATRIVTIDSDTGEKSMMNSTFYVHRVANRGKGIGTKLLHRQVKKAAELGIESIETEAMGAKQTPSFNGYYTWARLGYDGRIGSAHTTDSKKLKSEFPEAVRISDLMKSKEGRTAWKENGGTFFGSFDTRPGSQSRKVLDSYVKQRFGEESGKSTRDGEKGRRHPGLDLGQHRQREKHGSHNQLAYEKEGRKTIPAIEISSAWNAVESKSVEKASTASEYIATFDDSPLEELSFTTPFGEHSMAFVSEYPEWMKKSIQEYLTETFSQDYWTEVNMTTLGDITKFLRVGAVEGLSIEQMAINMMSQFVGDSRYAKMRGRRIARTEIGHALNGARSEAMQHLKDEVGDQLPMRRGWLSVLGSTTRDTHANLDGVPEDSNGEWVLGGVKCRWPSDSRLSAGERINCQCTVIMMYGLQDDSADDLISDYAKRMLKKDAVLRVKHGSHDQLTHGRGGSSSGGPLALTAVSEYGVEFETGKPVKVNFVRNTVSSQSVGGDSFQQSIEPAGRYMSHDYDPKRDPMPGWEKGSVKFKSPIVMELSTGDRIYGEGSWKKRLQAKYNKTGKSLSKAIVADGYDAIVTVNKRGTSEIVDLTSFTKVTDTQLKHGSHDQLTHGRGRGAGGGGASIDAVWESELAQQSGGGLSESRLGVKEPESLDGFKKQFDTVVNEVTDRMRKAGVTDEEADSVLSKLGVEPHDMTPESVGSTGVHHLANQASAQWMKDNSTALPRAMNQSVERTLAPDSGRSSKGDSLGLTEEHHATIDKLTKAIYENTQEKLAAAGVTEVSAFRGLSYKGSGSSGDGRGDHFPDTPPPKFVKDLVAAADTVGAYAEGKPYGSRVGRVDAVIESRAITSHSLSSVVAGEFTAKHVSSPENSLMVKTKVPAKDVFSTAITGIGQVGEAEVVLLGRRQKAKVLVGSRMTLDGRSRAASRDNVEEWLKATKPEKTLLPVKVDDGIHQGWLHELREQSDDEGRLILKHADHDQSTHGRGAARKQAVAAAAHITQKLIRKDVEDAYTVAIENGDPLPKTVSVNKMRALGMYRQSNDQLYVARKMNGAGTRKAAAASVDSKWSAQSNPVLHELGHKWHSSKKGSMYSSVKNHKFSKEQLAVIETKVSRYATKNALEFVAEVYAGTRSGKKYGDDVMGLFSIVSGGEL